MLRRVKPPFSVEFHHDPRNKFRFHQETPDDEWLAKVGTEGWIVFSHDRKFHSNLAECAAIKQYKIGCFYLWGANSGPWDKVSCFVRSYEGICQRIEATPKPFIYNVARNCRLTQVKIP
jgi:PIN like domain